jgi:hypothetical protein
VSGDWNQHIRWTVGHGDNSFPALTINAFADSAIDIGLTAASPGDFASIDIDLGDIVNLAAFGKGPVSGSFAASATGTGTVVITDGILRGSDSTLLTIDVTASLPAEHANIHLHLTDSLEFALTGSGYVGTTITQTAQSGGSAQIFSQTGTGSSSNEGKGSSSNEGKGSSSNDDGNFDLARFVTSVLNTNSVAVKFIASAPGESIHGEGNTLLKVDATADLPGDHGKMRHLVFSENIPRHFAFNDTSSTAHMPDLVMVSST